MSGRLKDAVGARRLVAQHIARREHRDPAALVSWMGALQAQDPAAARWAVGIRLAGASAREAAIQRALDDGAIIRTHVMRWTWQLVAPGDLHWILPLVGPEMIRRAARRFRELELDEAVFRRSRAVLERALARGEHRTRDELGAALEEAGIAVADGRRLSHLLGRAELEGLICSGAARGKAATFAWLEARAPAPAKPWPRERALAELARRYFRSRGPATLADFVWWSGLRPAEARAALESVRPELAPDVLQGREAWRDPELPATGPAAADAYLVPPFDELLIAYKDRGAVLDPQHARQMNSGGGMLPGAVVVGARVVGSWRRTLVRDQVTVEVRPFGRMAASDREKIARAADRYARFLDRTAILSFAA